MIKTRTIKYYSARRAQIIEILAMGNHSPDYVKMLEGARDMATERIQQLTNIAESRGIILASDRDRSLQAILDDVISRKTAKKEKSCET